MNSQLCALVVGGTGSVSDIRNILIGLNSGVVDFVLF
jgi:hypothetical protein